MKIRIYVFFTFCFSFLFLMGNKGFCQMSIIDTNMIKGYISEFNENDEELYSQYIDNAHAWKFLKKNAPYFDCPNKSLEETYYFRWWTFRKHIKETNQGFIITEFLPEVNWSGKFNAIPVALGHHFYEGRWLKNPIYLSNYFDFWLNNINDLRSYSSWISDGFLEFLKVHQEVDVSKEQLDKLVNLQDIWYKNNFSEDLDLFHQIDDRDGMEYSAGGELSQGKKVSRYEAFRPTLNSYMYGDALAIAQLARLLGDNHLEDIFLKRSEDIKENVETKLWDSQLKFFGSIPYKSNSADKQIMNVRELIGFIPWYFNLPSDSSKYNEAWAQLLDTNGFFAPFGLTTCEQRSPYFQISYEGHECQWNGPSWPFASSQTLTAMANLLNNYHQNIVSKSDFYLLLNQYAQSQRRLNEENKELPWIDEDQNPFTGDWISRTRLESWDQCKGWSEEKGGKERGKDYNHSTFCDLIISDLVGIRPELGDTLSINPLIPDNAWDYFCLDNLTYHGKNLTLVYDKSGDRYGLGKGFMVFINGKLEYKAMDLKAVRINMGDI